MISWNTLLYQIFHMPCIFQLITGFYCPGCGGTRALRYLLQGQVMKSLIYHPLVLYGTAVVVIELISWLIAKKTGNRTWYLGHETFFIYLGVGIVIANWIFKNVMLMHGILLLQ